MRRVRFMMAQANTNKKVKYGYLYPFYATQGTGNSSLIPQAMADEGWVMPTTDNYYAYIDFVFGNGGTTSGQKLKEIGTTYWGADNGTNLYNFNWRGAGYRNAVTGEFAQILIESGLWCYDPKDANTGYAYWTSATIYAAGYNQFAKKTGLPIRLMRSATVAEQSQANGTITNNGYTGNDGTKYPIIKLGAKMWQAVNLAETKLRDGSTIPTITDNTAWVNNTGIAKCAYNNDETNVFI